MPDACETPYDFCLQTGSSGAAAQGNGNALVVFVRLLGDPITPITGLNHDDFSLVHAMSPDQAAPRIVRCPDCFAELLPGLYRLVLQPPVSDSPGWKGHYLFELHFALGRRHLRGRDPIGPVLIPLTIPR